VSSLFQILPSFVTDLVFLGFFAMFITTAESLLNWGASFLVIDTWVGWFKKQSSTEISMLTMVLLSGFSIAVALNVKDLQQLIKITFSISAGVAPVFILRWVWFRINAWSQLSAMLSSGVYTLLYPWFHSRGPWSVYPMEESRVLAVTILSSLTWIAVTFITKNTSNEVEQKMHRLIGSKIAFVGKLSLALVLGVLLTFGTFKIWELILA
jgi:solute:Na+ symporter, SSS family